MVLKSFASESRMENKAVKDAGFVKLALLILFVIAGVFYTGMTYGYPAFFRWFTGDKTGPTSYESSQPVTGEAFEQIAGSLIASQTAEYVDSKVKGEENEQYREAKRKLLASADSVRDKSSYKHIEYFREAGIKQYKGPSTCLTCHDKMKVTDPDGGLREVDTMEDVLDSVHFKLFKGDKGFSTIGYDGRRVNEEGRAIPVGKIDRACGIPGSFSWTGWAAHAEAKPAHGKPHTVSEGCGQCHIGGSYGPPSDIMMPLAIDDKHREEAVDCLICHANVYDMNEKYVVKDDVGERWNQDRSLKSALSVGNPNSDSCLRCHQHNMGGDTYENNKAAKATGHKNPRLLHHWSKRGTAYSPEEDVHSRAGVECLDCHKASGHKIARGKGGVDLISNDLPDVDVSCISCHGAEAHVKSPAADVLNEHSESVSCQACHITSLTENSVVLIDWVNPVFNEEEGIWTPNPILRSGDMRIAAGYLWYNGTGSYLANALGDNPSNPGKYNPLMDVLSSYKRVPGLQIEGGGVKDNNFISQMSDELIAKRGKMVAKNILPTQKQGKSKIHPFHLFNAYMLEDNNICGPFGCMILPFDYKSYFETGDSRKSMEKAINHPMVRRMYGDMFKYYMLDEYIAYFGVTDGWKTDHPLDEDYPGNIEPHWMRQMATITLNHGIKKKGFNCTACHVAEGGLLDYKALGYEPDRAEELRNGEDLGIEEYENVGVSFDELYGETPESEAEEEVE